MNLPQLSNCAPAQLPHSLFHGRKPLFHVVSYGPTLRFHLHFRREEERSFLGFTILCGISKSFLLNDTYVCTFLFFVFNSLSYSIANGNGGNGPNSYETT